MPIYDVKLFDFQAGHATLTDCLTGNLRGYEPQDNETMIEKKFSDGFGFKSQKLSKTKIEYVTLDFLGLTLQEGHSCVFIELNDCGVSEG